MHHITHVCLPKPLSNLDDNNLWSLALDDQEIVLSIDPMDPTSEVLGDNWSSDWLSPMGLDLQINGGLGIAFSELTYSQLPKLEALLKQLWLDGLEAICPTFISNSLPSLRLGLEVLREARKLDGFNRCKLLGAHLEGPFLSKERHGAHSLEYLCDPSLIALDARISGFEKEIALMTLAPELAGSFEVINQLKTLGVVIALGHSSADGETSSSAFDQGVTMLTHVFNAMPGLHHRAPGPIAEAIKNSKISLGLIADGLHIDPTMVAFLQRLAPNQLVLVSDAIAPYGLQDGTYAWDERSVYVHNGCCRLQDGTLAGTTLPLLEGCKRLSRWTKEPSAAIWSATIAPRMVLENRFELKDYLIGQPLKKLLRWRCNPQKDELFWQFAA